MSKPKKPRTYHALSCSFADLFHSAEAWQLEKTLRLVRLRLVATESHESTGQTTLATVPNEVFELVVDNVRENSVRPANLERLVKAYSRYEQTINPEAVDYDAFYEWLSCQTRSDTDSECSCLAPLDSCRKCDTRYTWQEPSDHEVYGDAFRESEDYRALLDVANEMSFENCFWTSDRWYGDRKKFEVWEDSREDMSALSLLSGTFWKITIWKQSVASVSCEMWIPWMKDRSISRQSIFIRTYSRNASLSVPSIRFPDLSLQLDF